MQWLFCCQQHPLPLHGLSGAAVHALAAAAGLNRAVLLGAVCSPRCGLLAVLPDYLCAQCSFERRLVDDSLTCDALRKTAAFGDVLPFIHSLDPNTTIVAGNLECASGWRWIT